MPAATPRVYFETLGCAKNDADSRAVTRRLQALGVSIVGEPTEATHVVINTCGFIQDAKEESIDAILGMCTRFPEARVLVMGCLVERYRAELERGIPEVAGWFGLAGDGVFEEIAQALSATGGASQDADAEKRSLASRPAPLSRTAYAYVKISDGCDERCTFCAIPGFKGRYQPVTLTRILEDADLCLTDGARELVLVGQDTTRWTGDGLDLQGLIELLSTDGRVRWIRVMYLQPVRVTRAYLEFMAAQDKLCGYLDIPFQHSHREILRRMGRAGDKASYLRLVEMARAVIPDVSIRSTFILGFPGEGEAEFQDLLDFAAEARFDYAGGFVYSPEEGTAGVRLRPRVPKPVARERLNRLCDVILEVSESEHRGLVGRHVDVMVDSLEMDAGIAVAVGRTQGQAPEVDGITYLEGLEPGEAAPGDVVKTKITAAVGYDLIGEVCEA